MKKLLFGTDIYLGKDGMKCKDNYYAIDNGLILKEIILDVGDEVTGLIETELTYNEYKIEKHTYLKNQAST